MTYKHPTCSTCKHWYKPTDNGYLPIKVGTCNRIPPEWETCTWDSDLNNVLKDKHKETKAFANDGSSYCAYLSTTSDFYCPMHSKLVGGNIDWEWGHPKQP